MGIRKLIKRDDLIHPELSYRIVGSAFDVSNELGGGLLEKYYENALAEAFTKNGIGFERQLNIPVKYNNKIIGRRVLDFLVDGKIVVELKKDNRFSKTHIDQVLDYLRMNDLKLAILINFSHNGVDFKRIINMS